MSCAGMRELLIDERHDELDGPSAERLARHLERCPDCREERDRLEHLWRRMDEIPVEPPGPGLGRRFDRWLESEARAVPARRTPWLQAALAAAMLVTGLLIGRGLAAPVAPETDMARLEGEVRELRQALVGSMLKLDSASGRLQAVSWAAAMDEPDPRILDALLRALDEDPNVNVRLAALHALARFGAEPMVDRRLRETLDRQQSPLVQASLRELIDPDRMY